MCWRLSRSAAVSRTRSCARRCISDRASSSRNNAVAVHQDRLHALTRPGHEPAFYDLERITSSAVGLRVAQAESRTALQAISHVIEAREAAVTADRTPSLSLAQAAVARSAHAPRALGQPPDQPAPSAAVRPTVATTGPGR